MTTTSEPSSAPSSEPSGLDPRTERTRTAMLAASYDLLIAEGPGEVSHANVAARANVSRTTVYKHFPTQADLLRATIVLMGKPIAPTLTGDLRTDLGAMLADIVADLADDDRTRAIAAMIERAQHDDVVASVRDDLVDEVREQFAEVLQGGVERGELRADIDVDLALAGLFGLFLFKRLMAGDTVDDALAARAIDAFLAQHAPG